MNSYFIDTNIILRFLLKDHKTHFQLSKKLFKKAEQNDFELWTTDIVIMEVAWTLTSFYGFDKSTIRKSLISILGLDFIDCINKSLLIQALNDFVEKNVDLVDAYNYQLAKKAGKEIVSFDKHFTRLGKSVDIRSITK